jgi:nitronate monooxygenase
MGVGVSAHRLAGSVAAQGGVGTMSSVDLRRHHPDLMERTATTPGDAPRTPSTPPTSRRWAARSAPRALAAGRGLLAVNVMRAVSEYAERCARAGSRHRRRGGGRRPAAGPARPGADHPKALLVPILSDARGVALVVKKWERKGRLPDAIVIEHPRLAGGHLGAAKIADLNDPRFDFENVIPQSLAFLRSAGHRARGAADRRRRHPQLRGHRPLQSLGAAAVQLGTPFAVTEECDATPSSSACWPGARRGHGRVHQRGRPARARGEARPGCSNYLKRCRGCRPRCTRSRAARWRSTAWRSAACATACPAGASSASTRSWPPALRGDVKKGLFFRGAGALPFGEHGLAAASRQCSVRELIEPRLLTPCVGPHHRQRTLP